MHYRVYIVDDLPGKIASLDSFLSWLNEVFEPHTFARGFTCPQAASQSAEQIALALDDPMGLILLDVMMKTTPYKEAADSLQKQLITAGKLTDDDVVRARASYFASGRRAPSGAAIPQQGTELCAVVTAVAIKRNLRVVLCTTQGDNTNLYATLPPFPRIGWENNVQKGYAFWGELAKEEIKKAVRPFHPNPQINEAVCFALAPTCVAGSHYWAHKSLESGAHIKQVRDWLEVDCNPDSAKALLHSWQDKKQWTVVRCDNNKPIRGTVLAAAFKKVSGITFDCSETEYQLPFGPGLPFLMSLAAVCEAVASPIFDEDGKEIDRYQHPCKIVLSKRDISHSLVIFLATKTQCGKSVPNTDIRGLEASYIGHEGCRVGDTAKSLRQLARGAIELSCPPCEPYRAFFVGDHKHRGLDLKFCDKKYTISVTWEAG